MWMVAGGGARCAGGAGDDAGDRRRGDQSDWCTDQLLEAADRGDADELTQLQQTHAALTGGRGMESLLPTNGGAQLPAGGLGRDAERAGRQERAVRGAE